MDCYTAYYTAYYTHTAYYIAHCRTMHTVVNGPVYWFREKVTGMRTGEVSTGLDWSTVMA